jgi:hypothetical protein
VVDVVRGLQAVFGTCVNGAHFVGRARKDAGASVHHLQRGGLPPDFSRDETGVGVPESIERPMLGCERPETAVLPATDTVSGCVADDGLYVSSL